MKKTVFTLNIDNYSSEIIEKTYPFIEQYARKIHADFKIIKERKFPDYPIPYEKFQIYELGKGNDWNLYVDGDALIHPDTFDVTQVLPLDTVMTCKSEYAPIHFTYDRHFIRDNRHIYAGNWFTVASKYCIDLWHPMDDMSLVEAYERIHPTLLEKNMGVTPAHLLDDFVVSRNIAKFGLKYKTFLSLLEENNNPGEFLFHEYTYTLEEKLKMINEVFNTWRYHKR